MFAVYTDMRYNMSMLLRGSMAQKQYNEFASIYDVLMSDVDYDSWADYLKQLMGNDCKSLVECGCGTGEISLRLARAGYNVTGCDMSLHMLEVASSKARSCGVRIPFIQMDMRYFSVHKPVDCIISACDGVNYLTSSHDAELFFRAAFDALKPGGILLFDISSRYKLSTILGCNTFAWDGADASYIWRNCYDSSNKLLEMSIAFFRSTAESVNDLKLYERFDETHIQRAHSERELRGRLAAAGFDDIDVYEAFTLASPGSESERLQFVARKRSAV